MTMSVNESVTNRLRTAALVCVDAITYALVVTAGATIVALVLGIATGGGFVRAKVILFLGGGLLMAYATIRLWPSSPSDLESDSIPAAHDETRFQSFVQSIPPVRWLQPPPPEHRLTVPGKLFLGSIFVLLASYLMEAVFGVT
ncbi:DUF7555 family protein [Natronoglomus mannanivorans]